MSGFWDVLGSPGVLFGASWNRFGASWTYLGVSWGVLRRSAGVPDGILEGLGGVNAGTVVVPSQRRRDRRRHSWMDFQGIIGLLGYKERHKEPR